ncbi:type II secretion system GspH family protein [Patescibacteria group bacterium]|nr:type II secretion system GspH family protein [Patescibacteria group bacterium]
MRDNRGFTLIEMLIVIAIISVLSGIVLVGVSGFQAGARDTQRAASLRFAQNLVELYYSQCGRYPGGAKCVDGQIGASSGWEDLKEALKTIPGSEKLPDADDNGATFYYKSCKISPSPTVQDYVLAVVLEKGNAAAANDIVPTGCEMTVCSGANANKTLCLEP